MGCTHYTANWTLGSRSVELATRSISWKLEDCRGTGRGKVVHLACLLHGAGAASGPGGCEHLEAVPMGCEARTLSKEAYGAIGKGSCGIRARLSFSGHKPSSKLIPDQAIGIKTGNLDTAGTCCLRACNGRAVWWHAGLWLR